MISIAMANRKGGVGKTIISLSCAYTYAQEGKRVLLIDMDQQQSASILLGCNRTISNDPFVTKGNMSSISRKVQSEFSNVIDDLYGEPTEPELVVSEEKGLYNCLVQVIEGKPLTEKFIKDQIYHPYYKVEKKKPRNSTKDLEAPEYDDYPFGFDLLPSSEEMVDLELRLSSDDSISNKGVILRQVVKAIEKYNLYDIVIIDSAPSLGILTINAISAANAGSVIIGLPEEQSIFSLAKIKSNFRDLIELDPEQKGILGFIMNSVDRRATQVRPLVEYKIRNILNIYTFKTSIPRSAAAAKANSTSLLFPMLDNNVAKIFKELCKEILERVEANSKWREHRISQINEAIEKTKADENLSKVLLNAAKEELDLELKEKNISLPEQKYSFILEKYYDKEIKGYIKKQINNWDKFTY